MEPTDAVANISLAEQVADRLSQAILRGEYPPGSRLPEPELAAKFGVSRGPVREALFHLVREGMVQFRPRRGAIVRQARARDVVDLYNVRGVLFGYACRLAAPAMDPGRIARCREGVALLRSMAGDASKTSLQFLEVRTAISTIIGLAVGNRVLLDEMERLNRRALLHFAAFDRLERRADSVRIWEALLDAFAAGDGLAAEQVAIRQVSASRDEILRLVEAAGETAETGRGQSRSKSAPQISDNAP